MHKKHTGWPIIYLLLVVLLFMAQSCCTYNDGDGYAVEGGKTVFEIYKDQWHSAAFQWSAIVCVYIRQILSRCLGPEGPALVGPWKGIYFQSQKSA